MLLNRLKTAQFHLKNTLIVKQRYKYSTQSSSSQGQQNFSQSSQQGAPKAAYSDILSDLQSDTNAMPISKDDEKKDEDIMYDVAIIGGGSGGLSLALEAKKIGLNPVIFDYVDKSNQNYHWGLGGTCVNVGCIPKKLMHISSQIKETVMDSLGYGWEANDEKEVLKKFSWKKLIYSIRKYILDNNVYYEMKLNTENIRYINAFATLHDRNTIVYSEEKGKIQDYLQRINENSIIENGKSQENDINLKSVKAKYIVLCTGGRPNTDLKSCPDLKKYAMTSDDFFFNQENPGKTLVVGGGYIALETAGILSSLGNPVTLTTKGKYLRSFDQQMVEGIVSDLKQFNNVEMIPTSLPISVKKVKKNKLEIQMQNQETKEIKKDVFDSVVMAIGRLPNTQYLNLKRVGVQYNEDNGYIVGNYNGEMEQTSVDNIFAIGDILEGAPQLTPLAQKAGKFLAKRLFYKNMGERFGMDTRQDQEKFKINYDNCPTTIFTPSEYSCIGLSEEEAKVKYGGGNIVVYHSRYIPLEQTLGEKVDPNTYQPLKKKAYIKLICDKKQNEKIVGMHYTGPHAGEIMQGFSVLMNYAQQVEKQQENKQRNSNNQPVLQKEMTFKEKIIEFLQEKDEKSAQKSEGEDENKVIFNKEFLDKNIGIHPTLAEEFVNLSKKSFEQPDQESC